MAALNVIASGDMVAVVLPDTTESQAMTFEGIGLEEHTDAPVVVLRTGAERITYPLDELRIEPDEDD